VIVEVNDDGGDPPTWNLLGDSYDDILLKFKEMLKGKDAAWLKSINRVDLNKHIEDMALTEYVEQFSAKSLMYDVWHDIEMLLGAACPGKLTIKVFEMDKAKYEKAMEEAEDA